MVRTTVLAPPLEALMAQAGNTTKLRALMGEVPWATLYRWNQILKDGGALPRSAKTAIPLAEQALAKKTGKK